MRCLFMHKWVTLWEKSFIRSFVPYRTCKRCGTMQRGVHYTLSSDIAWETTRERTYLKLQQIHIARQPSSRLDQLAHTLGLRRSRMGDRTVSDTRSELIRS